MFYKLMLLLGCVVVIAIWLYGSLRIIAIGY